MKVTVATLALVGATCLSAYAFILGGQLDSATVKNLALSAFIVAPVLVLGIASIWLNAGGLVVVAAVAIGAIVAFVNLLSSLRYPGLAKDVSFGSFQHFKLTLMQTSLIGAYYALIILITSIIRHRR
jgi:hypothetical protein